MSLVIKPKIVFLASSQIDRKIFADFIAELWGNVRALSNDYSDVLLSFSIS